MVNDKNWWSNKATASWANKKLTEGHLVSDIFSPPSYLLVRGWTQNICSWMVMYFQRSCCRFNSTPWSQLIILAPLKGTQLFFLSQQFLGAFLHFCSKMKTDLRLIKIVKDLNYCQLIQHSDYDMCLLWRGFGTHANSRFNYSKLIRATELKPLESLRQAYVFCWQLRDLGLGRST